MMRQMRATMLPRTNMMSSAVTPNRNTRLESYPKIALLNNGLKGKRFFWI
jgi:hypothetical protein